MALVDVVGAVRRRGRARAYVTAYPESGAVAVVALAWVFLAVLHSPFAPHGGPAHATHHHGVPAPGGASPFFAIALGLPAWVLMTVAMMGRAAMPAVRYVAENTLRWRRQRAIALFAVGYVGVWTVFGAVAIAAVTAWAPADRAVLLAVVLGLAAAWQLTYWKQLALRAGHRPVVLPPRGWPATRAALRFGRRYGFACVGSCWLMMLSMAVATAGHLTWTAALACAVTAEHVLPRPRRTARSVGLVLAAAALAAALVAIAR